MFKLPQSSNAMALTPVKGKKALPMSTSLLFPEQSSNRNDLQLALDLVKFRCWKGDWRECATLCRRLLSDYRVAVGIATESS